jgi:hypothetical protein
VKKFIKNITVVLSIIGIFFVMKLLFIRLESSYFNKKESSKTLPRFLFFGDSHIETGIKNSQVIENLGKGAQPLFFTCIQAQQVINMNKNKTIIIGFDNYVVLHDERFGTDATNYFMNKYFSSFGILDHIAVFIESPKIWISHFFGIGKKRIPRLYEEVGFAPKINDTFQKAINIIPDDLNCYSYNNMHTKRLSRIISENPNTKFILFRTPFLLKTIDTKAFRASELLFIECLKRITVNCPNAKFIDLIGEFKGQKDLFFDSDHLNSRGADSLEVLMKKQLNAL